MVEAVSSGQVKPKNHGEVSTENRTELGLDHPIWALYET